MQPVIVTPPASGVLPLPLVCDSPHSGICYPPDFGYAIGLEALRRSEDTHVDALWDQVPAAGGTLLCATFPRSYMDTNRAEADLDLAMIEGGWPHAVAPSPRTLALGMGLVWRQTPQRHAIYDRLLSAQEVASRIDRYWRPYRAALSLALQQAQERHGACWHLNLHSMPSDAYARLGMTGKPLADVVLGDRGGTSCAPAFTQGVAAAFRACGYSVALNDPYAGADLVRVAGDPAHQRHSLQIEINRALYMDERTRERGPGFAQLKTDIGHVLDAVAAYVQAMAGALRPRHSEVTTDP